MTDRDFSGPIHSMDEILELGAGIVKDINEKDINEAVARKLGGERRTLPDAELADGTIIKHYPNYCHSIEAAWEIVEKRPYIKLVKAAGCFRVKMVGDDHVEVEEYGDTAPMAICLAFLKLNEK